MLRLLHLLPLETTFALRFVWFVLPYLLTPCVLIRNLILPAFPRNMKMTDPFLPNLKDDLMLVVALRILANYSSTLLDLMKKGDAYTYVRTRVPMILVPAIPREKRLLEIIKDMLLLPVLLLWVLMAFFLRILSTGRT